jgi:hypothetical protein
LVTRVHHAGSLPGSAFRSKAFSAHAHWPFGSLRARVAIDVLGRRQVGVVAVDQGAVLDARIRAVERVAGDRDRVAPVIDLVVEDRVVVVVLDQVAVHDDVAHSVPGSRRIRPPYER